MSFFLQGTSQDVIWTLEYELKEHTSSTLTEDILVYGFYLIIKFSLPVHVSVNCIKIKIFFILFHKTIYSYSFFLEEWRKGTWSKFCL
jgi:hypothetical protein